MPMWEDRRARIPGEIALGLVLLVEGVVERVTEVAVGGGLAVVTVGTGLLMPDGCRDLGDREPDDAPRKREAA